MRKSIWRDKFDPTAEYVVAKQPLLFGGRLYGIGELFNPPTTERQKRILYDGRHIDVVTGDGPDPEAITAAQVSGEPDISRYLEKTGRGWFNVLDSDRKPINDKKLRLKEAKVLLLR